MLSNSPFRLLGAAAVTAAIGLVGCGGGENVTTTTAAPRTVTVTTKEHAPPPASAGKRTPRAHTASTAASGFVACDANISARAGTTTCPFATNTFYEFYASGGDGTLRVFSPATGTTFTTRCRHRWSDGFVVCRTDDGGVVKFPQRAVDAYTDYDAAVYARKADLGRDGGSSPSSSPSDTTPSYTPPSDTTPDDGSSFCDTHDCIPNYPNGNGSTVQCADGSYSQSGGIQGACSHHGGVG